MDGNTRWAKKKKLKTKEGHKAGVKKARMAVEFALENNIKYLTLFAFSTENWARKKTEVKDLISLFFEALKEQTPKLKEEKVKLSFIGDVPRFGKSLIKNLEESSRNTSGYKQKLDLIIAASYGGKWDILNAVNKLTSDILEKKIKKIKITEKDFNKKLETSIFPDPDLVIRTGGEMRISNFYLWQAAYSELYFSKKLWPDFSKNDLSNAIKEYLKRKRKFGKRTG